ncbi:MAG: NAD-dependent epimerase/dehydratase family protein [Bacteroidetes bacterium]|nr:NAD-dependent epimerase/dehydratase family protein [Bacteroidota bacterium]
MKIAVTGANGHVGVNLCDALINNGHFVRALSHKKDNGLKHIKAEIVTGDLLNKDSIRNFIDGSDIVFHLAAKISIRGDADGSVRKINVEGTKNILELSRESRVQRFIHFSSIHAFHHGPNDELLDENTPLVGEDAFSYDRSKADGEKIVNEAVKDGFNAVILSPTAIIGPMDYEPSLMGKALLQLYHNQIPSLVPGGYNWVDVRDVVNAAISAIDRGRTGEKYLLGGHYHNLREVASIIYKQTGKKIVQIVSPFWLAKVGLPFITAYSMLTKVDPLYTAESLKILEKSNKKISNLKARSELDFNPRPLEETIRDIFQWFKETGTIN